LTDDQKKLILRENAVTLLDLPEPVTVAPSSTTDPPEETDS